jgi:hypothetical protein
MLASAIIVHTLILAAHACGTPRHRDDRLLAGSLRLRDRVG